GTVSKVRREIGRQLLPDAGVDRRGGVVIQVDHRTASASIEPSLSDCHGTPPEGHGLRARLPAHASGTALSGRAARSPLVLRDIEDKWSECLIDHVHDIVDQGRLVVPSLVLEVAVELQESWKTSPRLAPDAANSHAMVRGSLMGASEARP